eukprot:150038-Alexandrium_andersonii.AAC.1
MSGRVHGHIRVHACGRARTSAHVHDGVLVVVIGGCIIEGASVWFVMIAICALCCVVVLKCPGALGGDGDGDDAGSDGGYALGNG